METLTDCVSSNEEFHPPWLEACHGHVMSVVANCWRKIQFPSISTFLSWDSADRAGFNDARKDVGDLLQSVYTLSGVSIVSQFVDLAVQSLSAGSWAELEAAAFCLGALSDCVSDQASCDAALEKVFSSPLFEVLSQSNIVPLRARQTCLTLIERYSDYFERHYKYLPSALNLLFSTLGDSLLSAPSSKSIYTLCSACRSLLKSEVDKFLATYGSISAERLLDSLVDERIFGAIASIVQSIPGEQERLSAFSRLIQFNERYSNLSSVLLVTDGPHTTMSDWDVAVLRSLQQQSDTPSRQEVSSQLALRALRNLANIAKGMQSPAEPWIDVDVEQSGSQPTQVISPDLLALQKFITDLMRRLELAFMDNGEIVETVCQVYRAGFSKLAPRAIRFRSRRCNQIPHQPQVRYASPWRHSQHSFILRQLAENVARSQAYDSLSLLLPWVVGLLRSLTRKFLIPSFELTPH